MTQKIKVRIITPVAIQHELEADIAVLPGSEGGFGVMYNHVPMIVQLKGGEMRIENHNKDPQIFQLKDFAIARVEREGVDVLIS